MSTGDNNGDETFLQRWSRRKVEVRRGERESEVGPDEPGEARVAALDERSVPVDKRQGDAQRAPTAVEVQPPARPLTDEDFADVDFTKLDYGSDYSRFMAKGVPENIRQKALGQLWKSDAMFTQVDPFQDYAGDYTDAARAVPGGLLKTAYKVGQGFLSDEEAAEWDKLGRQPQTTPIVASAVRIAREDPDQKEVHAFFAASEAYMATLYPAESNHFVDIASLQKDSVRFYVARAGTDAIGCGAIVLEADGTAEIKRMWIEPKARGMKLGAKMLAALEVAARDAGAAVIRLETGISQPEALGLYRRAGFAQIDPFGNYKPDPLSVFMEKRIDGQSASGKACPRT